MTTEYRICEAIDLHVEGRITREDANRQEKTVREILARLSRQPGLILADEVGMGKTFVALAAAASVALVDPFQRPVVVMVPPSLKEKWPKDFALFREQCLPPEYARQLNYGQAERPVEFLKLLDDPSERRKQILLIGEHDALLAYYLQDTPEGWDGTSARMVGTDTDTEGEPVAGVNFERCYAHMFGPPNDEAFSGHPLAERGLGPYGIFEIKNSSWVRKLEKMNAAHPYHDKGGFRENKKHVTQGLFSTCW